MRRSHLPLILFFIPFFASADIRITEIMYDLDGADSGREWIEITNDGANAVDVSGFKFFEASTNHALTLTQGSAILEQGGFAVIADDAAKFLIDWPTYGGTLFDSSFSLSNTGETIVIRQSDGTDEDSVAYISEWGASGDGNALVRSGTSFVAAAPTPGLYGGNVNEPSPAPPPPPTSPSPLPSPELPSEAVPGEPTAMRVTIRAPETLTVGADALFAAESYGAQGQPLLSATYAWNFGNGDIQKGKTVRYAYPYPGKYLVSVMAQNGGDSVAGRLAVEALPAIILARAETDGSISVLNGESREVEISGWILSRGDDSFIIPHGTYLLPKEGVRFPGATLGLPFSGEVVLRYPNGARVLLPSPPPAPAPPPIRISKAEAATYFAGTPSPVPSGTPAGQSVTAPMTGEGTNDLGVALVASAAAASEGEAAALPSSWWWYGAFALLLAVGAGAAILIRLTPTPIDIIEEEQ